MWNGEFYPCKPDIFEKTYESMEDIKEKTADEIWLTIKQNENYEISNLGNVRNKKNEENIKTSYIK